MVFVALATASLTSLLLASSPTVAVVWLILTYVSSAAYICFLGQPYLAAILILVNVGAVALLVLFASLLLSQRLLGLSTRSSSLSTLLPLAALAGLASSTSIVSRDSGSYIQVDALDSVASLLYASEPLALVALAMLLTLAVGASLLIIQQ